jgi:hypothetical protein
LEIIASGGIEMGSFASWMFIALHLQPVYEEESGLKNYGWCVLLK